MNRTREERADARTRLEAEITELEDPHAGEVRGGRMIPGPEWTPGERERVANLKRGLNRLAEMDWSEIKGDQPAFEAMMRDRVSNPASCEGYEAPKMTTTRTYDDDPDGVRRMTGLSEPLYERRARTDALRVIERYAPQTSARSADRLDELVRRPDAGPEAAYIAAIGSPFYATAFRKILLDPAYAHLRFTDSEREAVVAVNAATESRGLALAESVTTTGGFAVPYLLDPTMVDTSAGTLCPLRQLATVRLLTAHEARFVNITAVVAQYQAEAAAAIEAGPTLSQPTLTVARGTAFVTASWETIADDPQAIGDLTLAMAKGRETVDATKFLTGTGSDQPLGVLTVGTTGALTTSQRVQTAVADTFSPVDVYSLYNAIPADALANLHWTMSPATEAFTYRMTPPNLTTDPVLIEHFGGPLLGGPVHKWSTMADAASGEQTGHKIIIGGDWKSGVIVGDRLGVSVEVIPNLFDGAGKPTGQRGLYMFWRTGCVVRNVNALRYLEYS